MKHQVHQVRQGQSSIVVIIRFMRVIYISAVYLVGYMDSGFRRNDGTAARAAKMIEPLLN